MNDRCDSPVLSRWVTLTAGLLSVFLTTGPVAAGEFRILLVGDSWAAASGLHRSLETVFAEAGFPEVSVKADSTAIGGSRADQWTQPERLQLIATELQAHPSIDFVHVYLGGNDLNRSWRKDLPREEKEALYVQIAGNLRILIDACLACRPDVRVVMCGYDYVNFEETRLADSVPWCATDTLWTHLGRPSPAEINQAFIELETHKKALAAESDRVFYVDNFGQMQSHFGYPGRNLPPGHLIPPGDPTLPSPPEALNNGVDCLHLSQEGYATLEKNAFQTVYKPFFEGKGTSSP